MGDDRPFWFAVSWTTTEEEHAALQAHPDVVVLPDDWAEGDPLPDLPPNPSNEPQE